MSIPQHYMATIEIPLTKGQFATVCTCCAYKVTGRKWHATWNSKTRSYYAARTATISELATGCPKRLWMHRIINNTPDGLFTDHIDNNTLNDRCSNLRVATSSQNVMNTRKSSRNKSGCKGVSFNKEKGKYELRLMANGKKMFFGYYDTIEEACHERTIVAKNIHGEFSKDR